MTVTVKNRGSFNTATQMAAHIKGELKRRRLTQ
jgi:hypothetical protein